MVLTEFRQVGLGAIGRVAIETMMKYSEALNKEWGAFEYDLLIRLDGLVLASLEDKKKPPASAKQAAEPEVIELSNSEGVKTLFRSIAAKKGTRH